MLCIKLSVLNVGCADAHLYGGTFTEVLQLMPTRKVELLLNQ